MEEWKDVIGYENLYQVSNLGNVKSLDRIVDTERGPKLYKGVILKKCKLKIGYMSVGLSKECHIKTKYVHRLLMEAFYGLDTDKACVNHINGDRSDNRIDNLEWVSYLENTIHAINILKSLTPPTKRIGKYDKKYNLIKMYKSLKAAAEDNNIAPANISVACNHKQIKKIRNGVETFYTVASCGGFYWKYL